MRTSTIALLLIIGTLSHQFASGRAFYVASNGNNSNPGSLNQPWQSLSKANATLVAGDTCYVRAGTYHQMINPANSGTSGNPIVYKRYQNESVTIDGVQDNDLRVVQISSDYVVIDGFTIRNQDFTRIQRDRTYWVNLDGDHILFTHNRIIADGNPVENFGFGHYESRGMVLGGHYITVEHCYLRGTGEGIEICGSVPRHDVFRYDTVNATMWNNIIIGAPPPGSDGNMALLIEYCVLDTSYGEDNIQFQPDYNGPGPWKARNRGAIIRHNYMSGAAEDCLDLKATHATNVFEYNVLCSSNGDDDGAYFDGGPGTWSHTPVYGDHSGGAGIELGAGDSSYYQIVRFNLIGDNHSAATMYIGGHYYNNTLCNNSRDYAGSNSRASSWFSALHCYNMPQAPRAFLNNLIVAQSGTNRTAINWLMDGGDKFDMNHNLYWDVGGPVQFRHREDGNVFVTTGFDNWKRELSTAWGYSYMKGKDADSKNENPLFVNVPANPTGWDDSWDFSLQPVSPARDGGGPLTSTTNSGSNATVVSVDDPYFFMDGYGIPGEGDFIVVGNSAPVKVTSVDYNGKNLTVQSPLSWTRGTPVYYAFIGSAPDIGAFEYGSPLSPQAAEPTAVARNVVNNPGFESGTDSWQFYSNGIGTIDAATPGYQDSYAARISIMQEGTNVQLYQPGLPLDPNCVYRISFAAYCTGSHDLDVSIQKHDAPYTSYGLSSDRVTLTNTWQTFSLVFITPDLGVPVNDARLRFWLAPYAVAGDEYWIDDVVVAKVLGATEVTASPVNVPQGYLLEQNYPNPFNPSTMIRYSLPVSTNLSITVFDILGQEVATVVHGEQAAGNHEVRFEGSRLSSGIYFYRIESPRYTETKRMLLVK